MPYPAPVHEGEHAWEPDPKWSGWWVCAHEGCKETRLAPPEDREPMPYRPPHYEQTAPPEEA